MVRRQREELPEESEPFEADLNEVVAYNFKRARELRGWTQDEVADRLEPHLGVRLPQASISGIERGYRGRHREFDAQELLAFACCFDVPIIWFLIPPPDDNRRLRGTSDVMSGLYELLLGREDQLELLHGRFRELGIAEPTEADRVWERLSGSTSPHSIADYATRRKELLLNLLDHHADTFDKATDELGVIIDKLREIGLKGYVASSLNDRDFVVPSKQRGKALSAEDEEARLRKEPRGRKRQGANAQAPNGDDNPSRR